MSKKISLKSFTIESFGGIDTSRPVLLYLEDAYKEGKNITIASGDEQRGKSSWLTALMYLLGGTFKIKEENFVNQTDGKLKAEFEFTYEGDEYKVSATKTTFKLLKREFNKLKDKEEWRAELEPVSTIKRIVGNIGLFDFSLKEKSGKDQVNYLRKILNADESIEKEETNIGGLLKIAESNRRDANKEYERLRAALEANELYVNWEESEKKYVEQKTSTGEKEKIVELEKRRNQYTIAEQKLKSFDDQINQNEKDISDIERQINDLQVKLELKKSSLRASQENKEAAQQWLNDNKEIVDDYEAAQADYMNIERYLVEQAQWQAVQKQKSEMDSFQEAVIQLDGRKLELRTALLEVGKKGLPQIDGLEVVVNDGIDAGSEKETGIYYNGKPLSMLSESEYGGLWLKIFEATGAQFIFLENTQNYGSQFIEILNHLSKTGCKIFATAMQRGQEFEITITDKI